MKIFAITSVKPLQSPEVQKILPKEVPATLKLYLSGVIEQFWMREAPGGPIFLLEVPSVNDAKAALDKLPLVEAGQMSYDLYPVGPLSPLGLLIQGK
jgi:hypothetical protein